MPKKTDHQLYLERKARQEKGQKIKYRLVQAVLKNIEIDDFLETLSGVADSCYHVNAKLEEFCKNLLEINGAFVIKPQSIADVAKIEEFTDQLYPYNFQKEAALQLF